MTNANVRSQKHLPVSTTLKKTRKRKKRAYNGRMMNEEHGFSLTGGERPQASMFHKHIAGKIANKTEEKYEVQT